jgi:hypothetical protein
VILVKITDGETHRLLEGVWFNEVKGGKYDEVECDEKDNPKPKSPLDEIVDRMVKEHQAQKLYNRLYDELGYDFEDIENIVDLVKDWLPNEQSYEGTQNIDTVLQVEGFNDCLSKIQGMLR